MQDLPVQRQVPDQEGGQADRPQACQRHARAHAGEEKGGAGAQEPVRHGGQDEPLNPGRGLFRGSQAEPRPEALRFRRDPEGADGVDHPLHGTGCGPIHVQDHQRGGRQPLLGEGQGILAWRPAVPTNTWSVQQALPEAFQGMPERVLRPVNYGLLDDQVASRSQHLHLARLFGHGRGAISLFFRDSPWMWALCLRRVGPWLDLHPDE